MREKLGESNIVTPGRPRGGPVSRPRGRDHDRVFTTMQCEVRLPACAREVAKSDRNGLGRIINNRPRGSSGGSISARCDTASQR